MKEVRIIFNGDVKGDYPSIFKGESAELFLEHLKFVEEGGFLVRANDIYININNVDIITVKEVDEQ